MADTVAVNYHEYLLEQYGIGTCFVCMQHHRAVYRLTGFVENDADGEAVVELIGGPAAWIAEERFRDNEPKVRITACLKHEPNIRLLRTLLRGNNDVMTTEIVEKAKSYEHTPK